MKIGIIYCSFTGNTESVLKNLAEKLNKTSHEVIMEKIELKGNYNPQEDKEFSFEYKPDPSKYEAIVFAGPVHAFNLNPVMKKYLSEIKDLKEKKVVLLTTEFLPFAWMGGNNAIRFMKSKVKKNGGKILDSGVINWSKKNREDQIKKVVNKLSEVF